MVNNAGEPDAMGPQPDVFLQQCRLVILRLVDHSLFEKRPTPVRPSAGAGFGRTVILWRHLMPARRLSHRLPGAPVCKALGPHAGRRRLPLAIANLAPWPG